MAFGDQGINLLGVLTDLESGEVMKFLERGALSADEILEARTKIHDGDFTKKLSEVIKQLS